MCQPTLFGVCQGSFPFFEITEPVKQAVRLFPGLAQRCRLATSYESAPTSARVAPFGRPHRLFLGERESLCPLRDDAVRA